MVTLSCLLTFVLQLQNDTCDYLHSESHALPYCATGMIGAIILSMVATLPISAVCLKIFAFHKRKAHTERIIANSPQCRIEPVYEDVEFAYNKSRSFDMAKNIAY